jgi:hypothetical protein
MKTRWINWWHVIEMLAWITLLAMLVASRT